MRLERKLTLAVLGLFIPPTVAAGVALLFLYRRGLLEDPASLLAAVVIGLGAMVAYLILVAHGIGQSLVRTIEGLRHGAELIATVNPEHRLDVRTGDELEALGGEINRLADRLRAARGGLAEELRQATREVTAERERLAAVIDGLPDGVVVATSEGRITLANHAARALLRGGDPLLGQCLFDFVDRDTTTVRLDAGPAADGAERVLVQTAGGTVLHGTVFALSAEEGARGGLLLSLRPPAGESAEVVVGAGRSLPLPAPPRPELFDFSLSEEMARHVGPAMRSHRLDELTFVVFDTETTGLRPEAGDRVVSLAGVRVRGGRVRPHETFDTLVDPGRSVPPESVRIHGITDEMLIGAPSMVTVLPAFLEFVGPAVLVGHEASFDLRFLEPAARRLGLPSLTAARPILDTRLLSRSLHGPGESHTLEAVAGRLGVTVTGRHSALGDALATAEIFVRLLALVQKRGILTLGATLDAVQGAQRVVI
ncbi:MAG TPA: exonuclease domain-containing protein [Candidatus Nitrosotalea sp.]|jgi:DNA polymerase-3 subunit epsilon|nr:exonuclease domain-containing protein [Candidatus Nitrosotalea sp.]